MVVIKIKVVRYVRCLLGNTRRRLRLGRYQVFARKSAVLFAREYHAACYLPDEEDKEHYIKQRGKRVVADVGGASASETPGCPFDVRRYFASLLCCKGDDVSPPRVLVAQETPYQPKGERNGQDVSEIGMKSAHVFANG